MNVKVRVKISKGMAKWQHTYKKRLDHMPDCHEAVDDRVWHQMPPID